MNGLGFILFYFKFIYFNWRLIILQYCIGSATHQHESAMGVHMFPILNPSSHLPPYTILPGHPSAPAPRILYRTWTGDSFLGFILKSSILSSSISILLESQTYIGWSICRNNLWDKGERTKKWGTSLVDQCLRLRIPSAEGPVSIPGQGTDPTCCN